MNNKGFAITGILYTIFAIFLLIMISALANISFKTKTLTKTISELEDDFSLIKVETLEEGYKINEENYFANYNGKYLFELTYDDNGIPKKITCTTYLKEDDFIPLINDKELGDTNPARNFTLIPTDCNDYYYEVKFSGTGGERQMLLKEIYKFKDSD